jgi:hypothetical protein
MNDENNHSKTTIAYKMLLGGVVWGIVALIVIFSLMILTGIIIFYFFPEQRLSPSPITEIIQMIIISLPFFFAGKLANKYLPPHFPVRYLYLSTSFCIPICLILSNAPVAAEYTNKLIADIFYIVRIFSPVVAYLAGIVFGKSDLPHET